MMPVRTLLVLASAGVARIAEAQVGQGNVVNAIQATDSSSENQAPQPKT